MSAERPSAVHRLLISQRPAFTGIPPECSGNNGLLFLTGAVGNATWAGTPLAPLLQEAGVLDQGIEVVFFGGDMGTEEVRDVKMPQHFARSMSVVDAMDSHKLLCYEMNGEALA